MQNKKEKQLKKNLKNSIIKYMTNNEILLSYHQFHIIKSKQQEKINECMNELYKYKNLIKNRKEKLKNLSKINNV